MSATSTKSHQPVAVISLDDFREAITAVLPHASTDKLTPVILGAGLVLIDERPHLVATDRYTIGAWAFDADRATVTGHEPIVILPPDLMKWLATLVPKALRRGTYTVGSYWVEIMRHIETETFPVADGVGATEQRTRVKTLDLIVRILWFADDKQPDDIALALAQVEQSRTFDPIDGNFPRVDRLLTPSDPEVVALDAIGLDARHLEKVTGYAKKSSAPISMTVLTKEGAPKHQPVRFTIGKQFTGLVQPITLPSVR